MADIVSVHVLCRLKELTHDATYQILVQQGRLLLLLGRGLGVLSHVCQLSLLLLIRNELGQTVVSSKLKHEVALVDLRIFVEGNELVDEFAIDLFQD